MATYECDNCGMAVNATCAKCDEPLRTIHSNLMMEVQFKSQNVQMVMAKSNHLCVVEAT